MTETSENLYTYEPDEEEVNTFFDDYDEESEEYYEKLVDNSLSKKSRRNFRSSINSSDSSTRAWNIDKTRQVLLQRLTLLPIGKHSFEVLSKFVINHQILKIVKVLKFGSCLDLHVKLNLKKQNVSELETYDSVIKVFQHEKNLRPDFGAAKKCKETLDNENKNQPQQNNCGNAHRTENIVFTKMIRDDEVSLFQTRDYENPQISFEGVLGELLKNRKDHSWDFMKNDPPKDMLWYKNQWMVICTLHSITSGLYRQYNYLVNLQAIAKVFKEVGVESNDLLKNFNENKPNTFCFRNDRHVNIRIKAKGGSLEVFTKRSSCITYTVSSSIDYWKKNLDAIAK